jgi:CheY-like chemotaxis protein
MRTPRSVLIADDNRDWTDTLARILRAAGYTVHTAYDGREAIEAATHALPDVVLLDIGMPKLTGYEVAQVFHRHPHSTRPLLIAVTAWSRESDKLRAQVAGFDYHFAKPVDPAAILKLLEKTREQRPPRRRVLVVDDNRDWTDSLARLLELDGHEVRKAYDGMEAIAAAAIFFPDVVILDLRMPRMSGHEAARLFAGRAEGTRPLLIAVSAADELSERQAAAQAGFDHFLAKPVQLDALNSLLAAAAPRPA